MILARLYIGGTYYYCSDEGVDPDYDWSHNWRHFITSLDSPQRNADHSYGGLIRVDFGSIAFSPELFTDVVEDWPPPVNFQIELYTTEGADSAYDLLFTGTAHRSNLALSAISYDLYEKSLDYNLLEEVTDYNGDTVPLPRALGAVVHVNPVRLPDVSGAPTYHKGYVLGTKGIDWHVFDDSVNVDANTVDLGDGSFKLTSVPVGEVTLSGTGDITTLEELLDWACREDSSSGGALGFTFDSTLWDDATPDFSYWAKSQSKLLDFISEACAWFGHFAFISYTDSTMYLVDSYSDNGTEEITESDDVLDVQYRQEPPVAILRSSWDVGTAVEETIGRYVKRETFDTYVESLYPYGKDINISALCSNKADIDTCLNKILTLIHLSNIIVKKTIGSVPPTLCRNYYWTDTSKGADLEGYFRVNSIQFDIFGDDPCYVLTGKGVESTSS